MARANQKSSRIFAGLFVCLFVLQAVAFFYHGCSSKGPQWPDADAASFGTAAIGAQALCEKAAGGTPPEHDSCNHIGFCVLCSADGRMAAAFLVPSFSVDYVVALLDAHQAPSHYASEPDAVPRLTTGWIASWSATSPPQA